MTHSQTAANAASHPEDQAVHGHGADHGSHGGHHGHGDGEFAHPAPMSMLISVFIALLGLTLLTVFQAQFDLGNLEIVFSLLIATIKAGLVIFFFMHLLWDKPLNGIIIFSSLIFLSLFLGITLMDAENYHDRLIMDPTKTNLEKSLPPATIIETSK